MGSNSNRPPTRSEKIGKYVKSIVDTIDTTSSEWQISKGAEIRGYMGVEKGNAFIKAINNVKRR